MGRRLRDLSWPPDPDPVPCPLVDGHTHLESVLAATDGAGWRGRDGDRGDAPARTGAAAARACTPDSDAPGFGPGREPTLAEHVARASAVGVTRMVQVGCDLPAVAWTDTAIRERPELLGGVAIHPNEAVLHAGVREVAPDGLEPAPRAHHDVPLDDAIAEVARIAAENDRVRAIGETGLDHFRAGERGRRVQREAFRAHIALAKELGVALQIHDRDAHDEVVEVLLSDGAPERTVFHGFSGDAGLAEVCIENGWFLSFAGPVTYRSSAGLRAALRLVPLSRVTVETDAPYLPPHPYRGRPNAPYLLPLTAAFVAAELGMDAAGLCERVSRTAEELYGPW